MTRQSRQACKVKTSIVAGMAYGNISAKIYERSKASAQENRYRDSLVFCLDLPPPERLDNYSEPHPRFSMIHDQL
jgi:hypothetical protein